MLSPTKTALATVIMPGEMEGREGWRDRGITIS